MGKDNKTLWIARDKNGWLFLYEHKPRRESKFFVDPESDEGFFGSVEKQFYPEIKWKNSPVEVELKLKPRFKYELQDLIKEIEELKFQLSCPDSFCKDLKEPIVQDNLNVALTQVIEELNNIMRKEN